MGRRRRTHESLHESSPTFYSGCSYLDRKLVEAVTYEDDGTCSCRRIERIEFLDEVVPGLVFPLGEVFVPVNLCLQLERNVGKTKIGPSLLADLEVEGRGRCETRREFAPQLRRRRVVPGGTPRQCGRGCTLWRHL